MTRLENLIDALEANKKELPPLVYSAYHHYKTGEVKPVVKPKERRVKCIETGVVFRSVKHASDWVGGRPSTLLKVLRGERDKYRNYQWEYEDE